MKSKLIIFDLDGTLIDSRHDIASAVNHVLVHFDQEPLSVEKIASFVGRGVRSLLRESLGEGAERHYKRAVKLFRSYYLEHCLDKTELYPNVVAVLESLSDRKLAIITNKPHMFTEAILEGLRIRDFFGEVVCADQVENKKPAPDAVHVVLERARVPCHLSVVVGDSCFDIQMGRAAGIRTCGVTYGYGTEEDLKAEQPDFLISTIAEAPKVLS